MSATTHGLSCGVVLGIVFVLLAQQFGFLSLSEITPAAEYLVGGAVVGGIIFGLLGWWLGHRYLALHPPPTESSSSP